MQILYLASLANKIGTFLFLVISKIAVDIPIDDNNSAKLLTIKDVPFFVVPKKATTFLSCVSKLPKFDCTGE